MVKLLKLNLNGHSCYLRNFLKPLDIEISMKALQRILRMLKTIMMAK